jgi:hypothetical protein
MYFPPWVEVKNNKKRAQNRLKYLLVHATHQAFGKPSIRRLATAAGCNHSSIFNAIDRGWFTADMAVKIEKAVGPHRLPTRALERPLDIEATKRA